MIAMADTTYHVPFPLPGTVTTILSREEYQGERVPEIDWSTVDRLITFMAFVVLDRTLRAGSEAMDIDIRFQIIERLQTLINWYKDPNNA